MTKRYSCTYISARTAFVQVQARISNLMNHSGMITIKVGMMVLLLASVVLFCENLGAMTRTNDLGPFPAAVV